VAGQKVRWQGTVVPIAIEERCMSVHRAARPGPEPTPLPFSKVRPSLDAKEAFAFALTEMNLDAGREVARLYGDDELLELEAIAAGTHPKQRRLDSLRAPRLEAPGGRRAHPDLRQARGVMLFGAVELRDLRERLAAAQDIVARVDLAVVEAAIAEARAGASGAEAGARRSKRGALPAVR
jgi:hypothetical protein